MSSTSVDVLREIAAADTVAAVWQRSVDEHVARQVAARLPRHTVERGLLLWAHDHHARSLAPLVAELEPSDGRDAILADARLLLNRWFEIALVPHAYVSLAVVADSSCHRLHVDRVGRRLLTTYVGAGTEWLDPDAAEAWRRDRCCWKPSSIERLATGSVIIMKGCNESDDDGLVHRSPPLEPDASPRLLLRICDGEYHLARAGLTARGRA
ncbi:MAG: DUF1826 domain-containing protein [Labilithrix sp.]|nr:DUF1826 domain-containing protein [Labilithrix sp.]